MVILYLRVDEMDAKCFTKVILRNKENPSKQGEPQRNLHLTLSINGRK